MKFYETHYTEYIASVEKYNLHPELISVFHSTLLTLPNLIFYGPTGVGKYSQILCLIQKYSPSKLKYEKQMEIQIDKQIYQYHISDIHYEIDMSLLGCNSKLLWHEFFTQVVDIVSMKPGGGSDKKIGIIVCRNFHAIHNELLDIFYSYIQHHQNHMKSVRIIFILMSEHIGFIPQNILQCSFIIHVARPSKEQYITLANMYDGASSSSSLMEEVNPQFIVNMKEIRAFPLISSTSDMPVDIFNSICDTILKEIIKRIREAFSASSLAVSSFADFRDKIYDILVYNLDAVECIWYIFTYLVPEFSISSEKMQELLREIYIFLRQYNNNYRPIFHLENIFFTFIVYFSGANEHET